MKKLLNVVFTLGICLLLCSPVLAKENVSTSDKIEFPPSAPSNYEFKNSDAKVKASSGCFFFEVSWKMQDIFRRFDAGEINEEEVAKLIKTEITPLLPNEEYKIALELSEQKARAGLK